jgi:hypothetical protein
MEGHATQQALRVQGSMEQQRWRINLAVAKALPLNKAA